MSEKKSTFNLIFDIRFSTFVCILHVKSIILRKAKNLCYFYNSINIIRMFISMKS